MEEEACSWLCILPCCSGGSKSGESWWHTGGDGCLMHHGTTNHSNSQCLVTSRDLGDLAEGGHRRVPGFSLACDSLELVLCPLGEPVLGKTVGLWWL